MNRFQELSLELFLLFARPLSGEIKCFVNTAPDKPDILIHEFKEKHHYC